MGSRHSVCPRVSCAPGRVRLFPPPPRPGQLAGKVASTSAELGVRGLSKRSPPASPPPHSGIRSSFPPSALKTAPEGDVTVLCAASSAGQGDVLCLARPRVLRRIRGRSEGSARPSSPRLVPLPPRDPLWVAGDFLRSPLASLLRPQRSVRARAHLASPKPGEEAPGFPSPGLALCSQPSLVPLQFAGRNQGEPRRSVPQFPSVPL